MTWYKNIIIAEQKKKYSYVGLNISGPLKNKILDFCVDNIEEKDLDPDEGREENPHVTVLYGLHSDSPDNVIDLLEDQEPFEIELDSISRFANEEHDVIKIGVKGRDLHKLNKKLKTLEHTSTYPEYIPHLTLAYVKKGSCKHLDNSAFFKGQKFKVEELEFSSSKKQKTKIKLG